MNEKIKSFFEEQDITSQQFNILRILRGARQPLSTLQIRERMLDKMSDTSRIVDRLIKKSLVKKNTCLSRSETGRCGSLLKRGRNLLENLDQHNNEMDMVLKNLTEEEASLLNICYWTRSAARNNDNSRILMTYMQNREIR
jgi:DNA-binding MarR family transcriptional regulator